MRRTNLAAGQAEPEPLPETGAGGGELRLDEAAQFLLELWRNIPAAQIAGETHRLLVGVDEGQASGAIREVLLELLDHRRLETLLNVLI